MNATTCDRIHELISARIDREIIFEDKELDDHLQNCAACRNELEGMHRLHDLLEQAFSRERESTEILVDKVKASLKARGRPVNRCTVLLVDDEPSLLMLLIRLLADEFDVVTAQNAREAQELFGQRPIDIILTDQKLRGGPDAFIREDAEGVDIVLTNRHLNHAGEMNGVELLEWVLANHPRTQRLLWTGYGDLQEAVDAINRAQVFRYLHKDLPDLNEAVRGAVRAGVRLVYLERDHERVLRELSELNVQLEERVRRRTRELEETNCELEQRTQTLAKFALTDALTLLPNRTAMDHFIERELHQCHRFPAPLAVAQIDLDFLKEINTKFLHPGGDYVLRELAKCMASALRKMDVLGRMSGGGDEFLLIAPQTHRAGALVLVERLRALVQHHPFNYNGKRIPVTVSIGLAVLEAGREANYEQIKLAAAAALRRAKENGRNCIEIEAVAASPASSEPLTEQDNIRRTAAGQG